MRAAVFKGPGRPLEIETLPDPEPLEGEIVIRVGKCGICGSDLHLTDGHGAIQVPPGHILGHEFAGEVVALGKGVQGFRTGDLITAMPTVGCGRCPACLKGEPKWCPQRGSMQGGYGEYLRTRATSAFKLGANLSLDDGALVEPLAVGLHGVERARMNVGDRLLVIGAGPVGLAAIYWARRLGAGRIAVTASSTRRAEMALAMGATRFVAPSDTRVDEVYEALGGPPDVVFECVGIPGMIQLSCDHVKPGGKVVVLGFCTEPDRLNPVTPLFKEVDVIFAILYGLRDFQVAIDTLDAGSVEPRAMITDRVSLTETPAMFEALRQRSTQCKVLIDPWKA
jgi:(R,R)-butanediol dehydrogenase/meso-butanediol dehydrogenase/diacetyl reductase